MSRNDAVVSWVNSWENWLRERGGPVYDMIIQNIDNALADPNPYRKFEALKYAMIDAAAALNHWASWLLEDLSVRLVIAPNAAAFVELVDELLKVLKDLIVRLKDLDYKFFNKFREVAESENREIINRYVMYFRASKLIRQGMQPSEAIRKAREDQTSDELQRYYA